ncbi:MAG: (d)CMP kinase [Clostridia bacterium]|nr:(d)CMP kinase [Clostridia bacterium]
MPFVVAIDGPAGTGKGTVTKIIADRLNLIYIDTGAMYRAVALKALKNNIKPEETEKIEEILKDISIKLNRINEKQQILLDGIDVTQEIRTPEVDDVVAKFAAVKQVREKMTPLQRKMKSEGNIIMEGRDIGTVVFPDADVKIYLDATVEERAKRRYKQNLENGIKCTFEEILTSIKERHILETTREIAPLKQAEDAIYVDSTELSIEEVVQKIIAIIEEKI